MTDVKIPVYALTSNTAVATLFHHGPEHLGGNGDLFIKLKSVEHLPEAERIEEGEEVC